MPIIEIKHSLIHQHCAACETERQLQASELGAEDAREGLPFVLKLPRCSCGASEHLIHSPQGEPAYPFPGTFGHLHRLLVDALLEVLVAEAASIEPLELQLRKQLGEATVETWFPKGLRTVPAPDAGATTIQPEKDSE